MPTTSFLPDQPSLVTSIAFLTDPPVVERILDHLHLPAHPPPTRPGRAPPTDPEFPGWQDETFLDRPPDLG